MEMIEMGYFNDPIKRNALCATFVSRKEVTYHIFKLCGLTDNDIENFENCNILDQVIAIVEMKCYFGWRPTSTTFWPIIFFRAYPNNEIVTDAAKVHAYWLEHGNDNY
jgi:hypothetical protein